MTIWLSNNYLWWKMRDDMGDWMQGCENPGWIIEYRDYLRARKLRWMWINNEQILISEGNRHKLADLYFDEVASIT